MKNLFLLGLMAMMAGFTACKKDLVKTPDAAPATAKQKINVADPGTVNELTLVPRQPGENFDTYLGNWGGVSVKVQGTPSWDHDKYPNLVNGVPCTGVGYIVGDQNQIAGSTAGGQSFFIVGVATATFSNQQAFINDLNSYNTAMDTYNRFIAAGSNATMPKASDYVKASYGGGSASYVQVPGKLIRITSGTSHFAFATITYPTPAPYGQPGATLKVITFDKDGYEYSVLYSGATITSGYEAFSLTPPYTQITITSASGSYTTIDSQNCNVNLTLVLANGNTVTYQGPAWFGL